MEEKVFVIEAQYIILEGEASLNMEVYPLELEDEEKRYVLSSLQGGEDVYVPIPPYQGGPKFFLIFYVKAPSSEGALRKALEVLHEEFS